ncbi:MAG: putative lipopolysaccharide biosynthesis protein [Pseudomonas sp.]|nr:putative lipopolysaccharide biosynthesis protein [Pseudomonas sp.]
MQHSGFNNSSNKTFDFICLWILPIGYLLLLSAMFFLPGRGIYHKLFYALFSIPTLLAICLRPGELKGLLREPLLVGVLLFLLWAILSLIWSPTTDGRLGLLKPPLHILMLFIGCSLLVRYRNESLQAICFCAAVIGLIASLFNLYTFAQTYTPELRMIGAGAFDNPLLSSHVFGFFCVYWLTLSMTCKRPKVLWLSIPAFMIMFATLIATGSRTPLVAISLAVLWLGFICWNRRSVVLLGTMLVAGLAVMLNFSQMIIGRGDSFRFEIWKMALEQIALHPWIGHGYDAPLSIEPGTGFALSEPHSFALGALYYVGIIGFLPWAFNQAWGLLSSWQQRSQPLFILASSWLMFGIGAGLTEGGGIIYNPKEHWFLLWIPLALIAALSIASRGKQRCSTSNVLPGAAIER